jgi:hypothetical protein
MLIYLGLSAVATVVATLFLLRFGHPSPPAAAHLVLAVGIMPLIFAAISHFVPVLTRSSHAHRSVLLAPLLLQLAGVLAFLDFTGAVPAGSTPAAVAALLVAILFSGWLWRRARHTLGRPHPGWLWYFAAMVFLGLALLLVPALNWWPQARNELRLLHLHLNTLGFVGLTALGTLQVLLPTVLSSPDAEAAQRLRHELPMAASGALLVAIGSAGWPPLALAGAVMYLAVVFRIGLAWLRRHGWRNLAGDGAAAPLAAALAGFLLLLVLGIAHALKALDGRDAVPAFVVAFLLPLLTGALTQLLPVWFHPGKRTPTRTRMHTTLRCGGALRALLFVLGGVLLALGIDEGIWLAVAGIFSFSAALTRSLLTDSSGPDQNQG